MKVTYKITCMYDIVSGLPHTINVTVPETDEKFQLLTEYLNKNLSVSLNDIKHNLPYSVLFDGQEILVITSITE